MAVAKDKTMEQKTVAVSVFDLVVKMESKLVAWMVKQKAEQLAKKMAARLVHWLELR